MVKKLKCLFCNIAITNSSLAEINICLPCLRGLKVRVYNFLKTGTSLEDIKHRMGLPDRLAREILRTLGIYDNSWIKEKIGSLEKLAELHLSGVLHNYANPEKNKNRYYIFDTAKHLLATRKVSMLTLPHAAMLCYRQAAECLEIDPRQSLVVERNELISNLINSWIKNWQAFNDGAILWGLNAYHGRVSQALLHERGRFNFVNFDFTGPWTEEVDKAVYNLFAFDHIDPEGTYLVITLAESQRWIENPNYHMVTELHKDFVVEKVKKIANQFGYREGYLWHLNYKEDSKHPMITIAFNVTPRKKASEVKT